MHTVNLSPLEPADVSSVFGLLDAANLPTVGVQENPSAFVVARVGDEIVGCCGVEIHGSHGLLRSLVVGPRHRGNGIARTLVEHVLSLPQHAGITGIYLLTTTARDFFPRFGFEVLPRGEAPEGIRASWEFRTGCPDTAVFMWRQAGDPFAIRSHDDLRAVVADAKASTKAKVVDRLGRLEREFISRAPLLFVATASPDGRVTVSPKGNGAGIVSIVDDRTLLIPERPGNGLAYGLSNMIDNPHVGIIFVIPGSTETFRVDGRVELTRDPTLLRKFSARGKDALLAMRVHIERCFFHCSKAFLRSGFWRTETWPEPFALSWGEWAKQWYDVPDGAAKKLDTDIAKDEAENL